MNSVDMAQQLVQAGKKGYAVDHVTNDLMKSAGKRMLAMQEKIDAMMTEIADKDERIAQLEDEKTILEERIAIMTEDEELPEEEDGESLDASAPGEAAYDFWDDDWPI